MCIGCMGLVAVDVCWMGLVAIDVHWMGLVAVDVCWRGLRQLEWGCGSVRGGWRVFSTMAE